MDRVVLHIQGMSCSHCLNAVNRALNTVPGVNVRSVQMGRAEVELPRDVAPAALVAAVNDAGYPAAIGDVE